MLTRSYAGLSSIEAANEVGQAAVPAVDQPMKGDFDAGLARQTHGQILHFGNLRPARVLRLQDVAPAAIDKNKRGLFDAQHGTQLRLYPLGSRAWMRASGPLPVAPRRSRENRRGLPARRTDAEALAGRSGRR